MNSTDLVRETRSPSSGRSSKTTLSSGQMGVACITSPVPSMTMDFGITHVIRAVEHLSNTPRQMFIARELGYQLPEYAHLPYVAEPGSGEKLSKRKLGKILETSRVSRRSTTTVSGSWTRWGFRSRQRHSTRWWSTSIVRWGICPRRWSTTCCYWGGPWTTGPRRSHARR